MKKLEDLTFADDFMFRHILTTKKEICKKLLELLLHIQIADIEYPEDEKTFKTSYGSRGIRVDVFVKGSDRIFDIEIQTSNFGNLPMRARYYQSVMDESALERSVEYAKLKESYVIFICTQDPFGDGRAVYTVEQKFEESGKKYDDKSHKLFYNVSAFNEVTDHEIKGFLRFVKTGEAETEFARELMEAIDYVKLRESGLYHHYMMVRLHESDVRLEAAHDARMETARNLLTLGVVTQEQIAQATGLPLAEVQQLAQEISVPASAQ